MRYSCFKKFNFPVLVVGKKVICFLFEILVIVLAELHLSGNDEAPLGNEVLSKKKRSRAAYKGHLSKLEKDITMFLN